MLPVGDTVCSESESCSIPYVQTGPFFDPEVAALAAAAERAVQANDNDQTRAALAAANAKNTAQKYYPYKMPESYTFPTYEHDETRKPTCYGTDASQNTVPCSIIGGVPNVDGIVKYELGYAKLPETDTFVNEFEGHDNQAAAEARIPLAQWTTVPYVTRALALHDGF